MPGAKGRETSMHRGYSGYFCSFYIQGAIHWRAKYPVFKKTRVVRCPFTGQRISSGIFCYDAALSPLSPYLNNLH